MTSRLFFSAVSAVHVPSEVTAVPSFLSGDARWLNKRDIWNCMRLVHDTKYPGAASQPSYMTRHNPILIAHLIELMQRGQLTNPIGLGEVLRDSLRLHGNSQASSPVIIIGDHTPHFRNVFIHALSKTVYFYDPMPHSCPAEVLQAFRTYHLLYDSEHTWQFSVIDCAVQFDYYSCGIWAMWMAENWLQFMSELDQQTDFRQWVLPRLSTPPVVAH